MTLRLRCSMSRLRQGWWRSAILDMDHVVLHCTVAHIDKTFEIQSSDN